MFYLLILLLRILSIFLAITTSDIQRSTNAVSHHKHCSNLFLQSFMVILSMSNWSLIPLPTFLFHRQDVILIKEGLHYSSYYIFIQLPPVEGGKLVGSYLWHYLLGKNIFNHKQDSASTCYPFWIPHLAISIDYSIQILCYETMACYLRYPVPFTVAFSCFPIIHLSIDMTLAYFSNSNFMCKIEDVSNIWVNQRYHYGFFPCYIFCSILSRHSSAFGTFA